MAILLLLFLLLFLCKNSNVLAQENTFKTIRDLFNEAVKDQDNRDEFYSYLEDITLQNPTVTAYKASAKALKAQDACKPENKKALKVNETLVLGENRATTRSRKAIRTS